MRRRFRLRDAAPWVLWPATAFVTFIVCLVAAQTAPVIVRERVVWAAMIGGTVFVANRNNVIWAIVVSGAAMWGVMKITDELPDPSMPHRRSIRGRRQRTSETRASK